MCCGIQSIGEWETCQKTLLWILFFFWYQNQKNITSLTVPAQTGLCWQKKTTLAQAHKCIFRPENGCQSKKRKSRNDQCQTLPTDKVSNKITCPFNMVEKTWNLCQDVFLKLLMQNIIIKMIIINKNSTHQIENSLKYKVKLNFIQQS